MEMDSQILDVVLSYNLALISERLKQAHSIAKAAQACADAGNISKGLEIVLDIEQLIYEVNTALNAACMLSRTGQP